MNMQEHWDRLYEKALAKKPMEDTLGLGVTCIPIEPLYVNEYHHNIQRIVFEELLEKLKLFNFNRRALDVGCGLGRWARILDDKNFIVEAIDLAEKVIRENRINALTDIFYWNSSIIAWNFLDTYSLITAVTVIQHIPRTEKLANLLHLKEMLIKGGYFLILDNVTWQSETLFPWTESAWLDFAACANMKVVKKIRYDYSPLTRIWWFPFKKFAYRWSLPLEKILMFLQLPLGNRHCAFLFQRP